MNSISILVETAAIVSPYYLALLALDNMAPWVTNKDVLFVLGFYFLARMCSTAIRDALR